MARSTASRENSRLLTVAIAVVVVAALYLAKAVLLPLALALLFAFLLSPLVNLLETIRMPRIPAILLVILTVFVLICGITWGVAMQLLQIADNLPAYRENISAKVVQLHHTQNTDLHRAQYEIQHLGEEVGLSDSPTARRHRPKPLGSSPERPIAVKEVSPAEGSTLGYLHGILKAMVETLLVIVFTFFMLLQREDLRNRLIRLMGRGELNRKTQAMDEASRRVSRYFMLLLTVNAVYGAVIYTALHFLGLPHALLFGALTTLLRFIPYIGAPISGLLPIALSLAVFPGWEQAAIIFGVFMCVEIVTANYIEPRLYGKHTGVSPLAILVAAVFWTLIWGPIGLLLSVPLTVCLVVVGSHVPNLKFLAVLLGDEPVLLPSAHYYQRLLAGDENEAREVLESYLREKPLEDLYDSVLIPALVLAEQDRHQDSLDETTVRFIDRTTKELIEELAFRNERNGDRPPGVSEAARNGEPDTISAESAEPPKLPVPPRNLLCVPVRDDADETAAIMLCHLLERAGHFARVVPIRKVDEMLAEISRTKPDIVYLSGVPPYALSYARGVYKKLRSQQPRLKILIGLWNYTEDPVKAAKEISRGEQDHVSTTLAQAVAQVGTSPSAVPEAKENVLDQSMVQA